MAEDVAEVEAEGIDADMVEQIVEIVEAVAEGEIPRASGLAILTEILGDAAKAEAMLADAGAGFVPAKEPIQVDVASAQPVGVSIAVEGD